MWIMPKHSKDIKRFMSVLIMLRESMGEKRDIRKNNAYLENLKNEELYKPTTGKERGKRATADHKIKLNNEFYGTAYEENDNTFMTAYGILLTDHIGEEEKIAKIFLTMLFQIQFPNPSKRTVKPTVKIYPFRLILNLMNEELLERKMTNIEIAKILYYKEKIENKKEYEETINEIIEERGKKFEEKMIDIVNDSKKSEEFTKNYNSINYSLGMMKDLGICEVVNTGNRKKIKSPKQVKPVNIVEKEIKMNKKFLIYFLKLKERYLVWDKIIEREGNKKWKRGIYDNFYPEIIEELGYEDNSIFEMIKLKTEIVNNSKRSDNPKDFEITICKFFNYFEDIEAEVISGSGDTDVFCEYFGVDGKENFVVDAKSTKSKQLSVIPSSRIDFHREKNNAKYAIVISHDFAPGCDNDIKKYEMVMIKANVLVEIVSKYLIVKYIKREPAKFEDIHKIISNNFGRDCSNEILKYVDDENNTKK